MLVLLSPVPAGTIWNTTNWRKFQTSITSPYYSSFEHWAANNTRTVSLSHLIFAFTPRSAPSMHLTLRLEHLIRGSYEVYANDQFSSFIGIEQHGVCTFPSSGRRWESTSVLCEAPATVHVYLCFRKATSNLKISLTARDADGVTEESSSVVVALRGGSTSTASASRKRKAAGATGTEDLSKALKALPVLDAMPLSVPTHAPIPTTTITTDTSMLGLLDTIALLPTPLPLSLSLSMSSSLLDATTTSTAPASIVPVARCCCAPPATDASKAQVCVCTDNMECCTTTNECAIPAQCATLTAAMALLAPLTPSSLVLPLSPAGYSLDSAMLNSYGADALSHTTPLPEALQW